MPAAIPGCSSTPPSTTGTPAPNSGRINASNPCSEYMHLDNSACNLASLNLMKFIDERGEFDVRAFRHAVDVMITAQDIVVDNSSYPTDEIAQERAARFASSASATRTSARC